MAHFRVLKAVAVPFEIDNIDTDQIFPSRFVGKNRTEGSYRDYFFHDQRFVETDVPIPDFVLNKAAYRGAAIIVASANYACGSARPGAIYSHLDYGISAIIATSFGSVFPTVAYKSGLLTIQVGPDTSQAIRDALLRHPGAEVEIDLDAQSIVLTSGQRYDFEIDSFVKTMFMEGISEIDYTLKLLPEIEAKEAKLRNAYPWFYKVFK